MPRAARRAGRPGKEGRARRDRREQEVTIGSQSSGRERDRPTGLISARNAPLLLGRKLIKKVWAADDYFNAVFFSRLSRARLGQKSEFKLLKCVLDIS